MNRDPQNIGWGEVDREGIDLIPEPPESLPPGKFVPYRPKGWPKNCIILPVQVLDPPEPIKHPAKEPKPE